MSIVKAIKRYLWDGPLSILPAAGAESESAEHANSFERSLEEARQKQALNIVMLMTWAPPGKRFLFMFHEVTVVKVRLGDHIRSMHPLVPAHIVSPALVVAYFNKAGDLKTAELPFPLAMALRQEEIDAGLYTPPEGTEAP